MRRPKAKSTPLVGRAPLGSLPAESGQSAATSKHDYSVGDIVFWGTPTTAGEYIFIGHPKGDRAGKVLVLALGAEIGYPSMPGGRALSFPSLALLGRVWNGAGNTGRMTPQNPQKSAV